MYAVIVGNFLFHALGMSLSGSSYSYHLLPIMFALVLTLFFHKPQISFSIKNFVEMEARFDPSILFLST